MNKIFYSILIPVYNVEKYVSTCLESVLKQTYSNFEIILVNDGSTDSSLLICEEYARRDERIKIYNRDNHGLLLTRRFSIKQAKGEYILFLDSDDYWEENLLEEVNKGIEKYNCDMLLFRFKRVYDNGEIIKYDQNIFENETLFTKDTKELLFKEFIRGSRLNSLWTKVVKNEIIDVDTDYTEFKDKKSEDLLQSMPLLNNANSILYLDMPLYNYRLSVSGRGRNFNAKYINDIDAVRKVLYRYMVNMGYDNKENSSLFYSYYVLSLVRLIKQLLISDESSHYKINLLEKIQQKELYNNSKEHINVSSFDEDDKIIYFLFNRKKYNILIKYVKGSYYIKTLIKSIYGKRRYK